MNNGNLDVETLGQVFTPWKVVRKMLSLRQNKGSVLEPSCGDGAFLNALDRDALGVEVDSGLSSDPRVVRCDFFDYPTDHKFDTIVGNPPYVRFRDIHESTRNLLDMRGFDARSNLYLFFIGKCIDHLLPGGELIFITPRDFLKATSAGSLNSRLYAEGTITHYYELGDECVFSDATPNCAIWRWAKGNYNRVMTTGGEFACANGQICFANPTATVLGDYFDIKVGAVSGADDIFASRRRGCTDMVCSTTAKDGILRRVIYDRLDSSLKQHKSRLIGRRIRRFNESNWWEWGRKYHKRQGERIYVNAKTRHANPFFVSDAQAYDGSVLALLPNKPMNLVKAADTLNRVDWHRLGFVCGGRLLFSQRSLSFAPVAL